MATGRTIARVVTSIAMEEGVGAKGTCHLTCGHVVLYSQLCPFYFYYFQYQLARGRVVVGGGCAVRRTIGTRELRNLDPFLMLDEFFVKVSVRFFFAVVVDCAVTVRIGLAGGLAHCCLVVAVAAASRVPRPPAPWVRDCYVHARREIQGFFYRALGVNESCVN